MDVSKQIYGIVPTLATRIEDYDIVGFPLMQPDGTKVKITFAQLKEYLLRQTDDQ